ncbi:MAG: hypothetical protein KDF60_20030, partial [Calditrichaeota bacterium]|nr:hypothetical protein [Calditrichota bacterium]
MRIALSYSTYQNILLSAFIISGGIKTFFIYYNFRYDITLLIIIAIFIDIIVNLRLRTAIRIKKATLLYPLLIACLVFLSLLSLSYSPSPAYKYEKFVLMFIPVLGFIYPVFIKELKLKILYKTILYIVVPICIWFIFFRYLLWYAPPGFLEGFIEKPKFSSLRNSYLVLGYLIGLLMILSVKYARFK